MCSGDEFEEETKLLGQGWRELGGISGLIGEFPDRFAVVYGSDVVYTAQDIRPLVECACTLLQRGPAARLVLAMMRRSERSALRTTLLPIAMMID